MREIAALTYIMEKKFNKSIHVLTDLCYVIPSYMLRIGEDNSGTDGGIRFCSKILASTRSRGSSKRSFNIMTSTGSAKRPI